MNESKPDCGFNESAPTPMPHICGTCSRYCNADDSDLGICIMWHQPVASTSSCSMWRPDEEEQ